MKITKDKFRIIGIVALLFIIFQCGQESEKSDKKSAKTYKKTTFNKRKAVIDIINDCLEELVPKEAIVETKHTNINGDSRMYLYIYERLLVADEADLDQFVEKGGDKLLMKLDRKHIKSRWFDVSSIDDFDSVYVAYKPPITLKDQKQYVGGVNFSRIVFNKDRTMAVFIFDFEKFHYDQKGVFCAIEVARIDDHWEITRKICIDKYPAMLYE